MVAKVFNVRTGGLEQNHRGAYASARMKDREDNQRDGFRVLVTSTE